MMDQEECRTIARRLATLHRKLEFENNTGEDRRRARSLEDQIGSFQQVKDFHIEEAKTLLRKYGI